MDKHETKKPYHLIRLLEEEMGSSSVGVERFELPISCSQSRLKILCE
jgi:hypothetical protein